MREFEFHLEIKSDSESEFKESVLSQVFKVLLTHALSLSIGWSKWCTSKFEADSIRIVWISHEFHYCLTP